MHSIIESLPIDGPLTATLASGRQIQFVDRQIIVWVSVSPVTVIGLSTNTPRLPAVLDTGFNSTFAINEEQLTGWAGVELSRLREFPEDLAGLTTVRGQRVPSYEAVVWLHSNVPGQRDVLQDRPAFWTNSHPGILVLPPQLAPRLPLIGLKMIEQNGLQVSLDPVATGDWAINFRVKCSIQSALPPMPHIHPTE